MEINKQKLGDRIRNVRNKRLESMEKFGQAIADATNNQSKSGKSNVSRWERGENIPNNETLKAIADLGDLTVDELLYGSERDYIVPLIQLAVKKHMHIDLDTEEAHHVYNRMHFLEDGKAYSYSADSLFDENREFFERTLLKTTIKNKTGLIQFSLNLLNLDKIDISSTYKDAVDSGNAIDENTYKSIVATIDKTIEEIKELHDPLETLDFK